jgi:ENTS family enterobactin (siderophore) exporter
LKKSAIGGVFLARLGTESALLFEAATQLTAVIIVLGLRVKVASATKLGITSAVPKLLEGFRYIKGEPRILGLFLMATIPSVMVMPFIHGLMPVYAAEILSAGPASLGLLFSAIGAGATLGTLALATLGDGHHKGLLLAGCIMLMVCGMVLFSRNASLALAGQSHLNWGYVVRPKA